MNLWKIFMCTNANSICKFYFPCLNFFFTELMSPLVMYKITYPARTLRALGLLLADGVLTMWWGKTFWRVGRFFFTTTAVTRKWKAEKLIPRSNMARLSEGYKRAIDKIWGRKAKNGFSRRKKVPLNGHKNGKKSFTCFFHKRS